MVSLVLYRDLIWLVNSLTNIIMEFYTTTIEARIQDQTYSAAIKILTIERQTDKYDGTHPQKFISRYKEFLNKRIQDFKELLEIDKIDFGGELKEVIKSYKLGLEVNVIERNLLSLLLNRKSIQFVENLKNALLIPSYYDSEKNEKAKYYHIYLLGVLEGRLNLYNLKSNKESGYGRYDICAFPVNKSNPGLLIEVKSDSTEGIEALEQIEQNIYVNELRIEGVKEVLMLAINFRPREITTDHKILRLSK